MEKLYELTIEYDSKFGKNKEKDLEVLIEQCRKYKEIDNLELITKAFNYCYDAHYNIKRVSGAPYYVHPLKVAIILINDLSVNDSNAIASSLIHDTVEDNPDITIADVEKIFGHDIATLVDGVTKIKDSITRASDKAATYAKLFLALVKDPRVILIKLADRLDNMRTLQYLKDYKQEEIGSETLNFYVPIAHRLGLMKIKQDLENLSLYFTDRQAFETIRPKLEEKRSEFLNYIMNFNEFIDKKLSERDISHILTIEHKHEYEIFKMMQQGKELKDIDNFYSIVITLDTNDFSECYRTYGIIANIFGPVSSLNDYIARPRINFYRALHSTHFGPGGKHVEVIIRTDEMDKIADGGIAKLYSINKMQKVPELAENDVQEWVEWMQDIINESEEDAIQKIWGSIRMNLYEDDILVHTVTGQSYILPKSCCPIDLAFAISKDYGLRCISAKVNGEVKSLDYELNNNDEVEIITSNNIAPSIEWQSNVITYKAIVGLYKYFKEYSKPVIKKEEPVVQSVKLLITGEDRPGILYDITKEIGEINIKRINLSSSNSLFEGAFILDVRNKDLLNNLLAKLLTIKGLKSIDRIIDEE